MIKTYVTTVVHKEDNLIILTIASSGLNIKISATCKLNDLMHRDSSHEAVLSKLFGPSIWEEIKNSEEFKAIAYEWQARLDADQPF